MFHIIAAHSPTYSTVQKNTMYLPKFDYSPFVKSPKYEVKKHEFSADISKKFHKAHEEYFNEIPLVLKQKLT